MQVHLVSGFLGSGKTTAIGTACKTLLDNGYKAGVITNDQGIRLVDSGYFDSLSIPNKQVVGGCFCCHYDALDANIQSLIEAAHPDVIFAESVGSCTDIVATVMKPLQRFYNNVEVSLSTFADVRLLHMLYIEEKPLFDDDVKYIYEKQLEEAGVIVLTKKDLVDEKILAATREFLQQKYPAKKIICIDANREESVACWTDITMNATSIANPSSLEISYDRYGAGEAALAWLDEELELTCGNKKATASAILLTKKINQKIRLQNLTIGHLKFLINGRYKLSYTASAELLSLPLVKEANTSTILINARVQTTPDSLQQLVADAIEETARETSCEIRTRSLSSFQPGYPTPTHRMA